MKETKFSAMEANISPHTSHLRSISWPHLNHSILSRDDCASFTPATNGASLSRAFFETKNPLCASQSCAEG
jgi:hypothetical protein